MKHMTRHDPTGDDMAMLCSTCGLDVFNKIHDSVPVTVISDGIELPRKPRNPMTRICITGGPRTGKTTLATQLCATEYDRVRHTDDLIGRHDWSAASAEVATWLDEPGPWIIEGVSVSRALRKWREGHPGDPPPVDRVIYLETPHEPLSKGQSAMAKGVATVHAEIEDWLREHNIETERR
jgi:GTPase SAR1 family protein